VVRRKVHSRPDGPVAALAHNRTSQTQSRMPMGHTQLGAVKGALCGLGLGLKVPCAPK